MNKMELLRADAEPGRCAVCSEALKGKRTVLCGARECADVYALTAQMVTTEKRLKACCERAGLARARRGK